MLRHRLGVPLLLRPLAVDGDRLGAEDSGIGGTMTAGVVGR
jgi:hypothetical protein